MEQRLSVITLGVRDLAAARGFYADGLGWTPAMEAEGEVVFFNLSPGVVLGLYNDLARDSGTQGRVAGLSAISQNLPEKAQVDEVLAQAERAGATITKPAHDTDWGGRTGYFADPDGHLWEIAWNPFWPVDAEGRIAIPPR